MGNSSIIGCFSFLPIFSASSILYMLWQGTPWGYFIKHFVILTVGFILMFSIHKIPFRYFKGISILMLPIVILLLIYIYIYIGTIIGGANASRWIKIPIVGLSFQTSTLASVILMIYVASYLSKLGYEKPTFKSSFFRLWLPVIIIVCLIFPSNLSTAVILFSTVLIISFIAGYSFMYLLNIIFGASVIAILFFLLIKAYPSTHSQIELILGLIVLKILKREKVRIIIIMFQELKLLLLVVKFLDLVLEKVE